MVMYGFWRWVRKEGCRCDGMRKRDVRNVFVSGLGARNVGEWGEFQMVMYGFWWVRKEGCRCDGMSERDVRNVFVSFGRK
eukprot:1177623-Prorocentrum_minimum.AAC.2